MKKCTHEYDYFGNVLEYDYFASCTSTSTQKVLVLEYKYTSTITPSLACMHACVHACVCSLKVWSPLANLQLTVGVLSFWGLAIGVFLAPIVGPSKLSPPVCGPYCLLIPCLVLLIFVLREHYNLQITVPQWAEHHILHL